MWKNTEVRLRGVLEVGLRKRKTRIKMKVGLFISSLIPSPRENPFAKVVFPAPSSPSSPIKIAFLVFRRKTSLANASANFSVSLALLVIAFKICFIDIRILSQLKCRQKVG